MATHPVGDVKRAVRERYARAATEGDGCCEPSCCGPTVTPSADRISEAVGYTPQELADVPAEAVLGLGCGNPTALAGLREGETVLDLGSGGGIDCFLAAKRVGPGGRVIGVDMTPEMIERARSASEAGRYDNVEFRLGEIEALPVADGTVDVIISNCVLNLSTDRPRVLREAYRVLKPGGRLVVSDMISDRPVPTVLAGSLDAVAACLPTPRDQYLAELAAAGFVDARVTSERAYPPEYILDDPGVRTHIAANPHAEGALRAFAESISGASFEAVKP